MSDTRSRGRPRKDNPLSLTERSWRQRRRRALLTRSAAVCGVGPHEVWILKSLGANLKALADYRGVTPSELVNEAIYDYLVTIEATEREATGIELKKADRTSDFGIARDEAIREAEEEFSILERVQQ